MREPQRYFDWLIDIVCDREQRYDYQELMRHLYTTEFYWTVPLDENRAIDGVELRVKYREKFDNYDDYYIDKTLDDPCTVLEMLIALAARCEEEIMHDPYSDIDNTGEWFWEMINNLGLACMDDSRFSVTNFDDSMDIFMGRKYNPDGSGGGLFLVANPRKNLKLVDIWYQMQWFLSSLN